MVKDVLIDNVMEVVCEMVKTANALLGGAETAACNPNIAGQEIAHCVAVGFVLPDKV
jgi:hypothetical protein